MSSIEDDIKNDMVQNGEDRRSELSKVVDTLLNEQFKRRKTRLKQRQVPKLSILETIANLYDIEFLKTFITNHTEYLTSLDGKGRQEIVDITKYTIDKEASMNKQMLEAFGRR